MLLPYELRCRCTFSFVQATQGELRLSKYRGKRGPQFMGCPDEKMVLETVRALKLLISRCKFLRVRVCLLFCDKGTFVLHLMLSRKKSNRNLRKHEGDEESEIIPNTQ